jgi:hypothetical protein
LIRLLRKYCFDLLKYNLFLSALGGWFGTSLGRNYAEFFLLTFVSLGFTGSLYFYNYFQANEYYFYYNKGLGKRTLNTAAGIANLLMCSSAYAILRLTGAL